MNYIFNIIFPPPEFTVGNSPKLLVTSPRNKIERNSELLLDSSLNIETIEMLEKKIEESENLSSVIIDIGGNFSSMKIFILTNSYLFSRI